MPPASTIRSVFAVLSTTWTLMGVGASFGQAPPPTSNPAAVAASVSEMKPYVERISHASAKFTMTPIPGGTFRMGSPVSEAGREPDEGPPHDVRISPFWMSTHEITWDAYEVFMIGSDNLRRELLGTPTTPRDKLVDAVTRPTKPYTDMSFGMGKRGYPAICMTQHAARTFCKWLSAKTGRYYRLPTEAEWEYACRAGTTTAYSFGDRPEQLGDYAWYAANSDDQYQKVGGKKPNPWGLYDMHGNVAEWVLDQYDAKGYEGLETKDPLRIPTTLYPRVVRGGAWDMAAETCRSSARLASEPEWKDQDPQTPRSIWYHTDALGVGFRVVRPLVEPSEAEKRDKWDKSDPPQRDEETP